MLLKQYIQILLSSLLLLISCLTLASNTSPDSLKKNVPKFDSTLVFYFHNDVEKFGTLNLSSADTGITGYQNYDPLFKSSVFLPHSETLVPQTLKLHLSLSQHRAVSILAFIHSTITFIKTIR